MDTEQLIKQGYIKKHTSYIRRYVSRKTGSIILPYSGRFGNGYMLLSCNYNSTRYSFVTYYTKP